MIYADNAASSRLDEDALKAMLPFMLQEYGNPSQPYSFSRSARNALGEARATIADCIGAEPGEIYFTSGGTESDNWAIKCCWPKTRSYRVITSSIEHHAVLNTCQRLQKRGATFSLLPVNEQGFVNKQAFMEQLTRGASLVSVMLANNEIGSIQPVADFARLAHAHGALMHTDAVQALGHIAINVRELGVDMLSASAHKFNGPKGSGFLYIKKGTLLEAMLDGGTQESGLRAGTENVAAIVGMACALRKNCERMRLVGKRLFAMEEEFIEILDHAGVDYLRNGAPDHIPGNINISIRGVSGESLMHLLDLQGICISTGAACDSKNLQISHVIKAIRVPDAYARGTVRVSFGADNAEDDAGNVAKALVRSLGRI